MTGPKVTAAECQKLQFCDKLLDLPEHVRDSFKKTHIIPACGDSPPKQCYFLKGTVCEIYPERPQSCRDYPLYVIDDGNEIVVRISDDCPRAELIAKAVTESSLRALGVNVEGKKLRIEMTSFYEESISDYYGEEY
ncbi:YkgJ family cysteine cluster protein [Verrucomicrobiota bacterium]